MSGGLPPATAVESSGARLSPPDVYLTLTFGYCSLNPSITAWNDVCSSPAQIAIIESEPETSLLPLPLLSLSPPPPQAAAPKASATASAAKSARYLILMLLPQRLSVCMCPTRKSHRRSRDRRGAPQRCRPRRRSRRRSECASEARTGRPSPPFRSRRRRPRPCFPAPPRVRARG